MGKSAFEKKPFFKKNHLLLRFGLFVGFGLVFFWIQLFPSAVAFWEDQKLRTEVTSARWHCCVFSSLGAVVSGVQLQGFRAVPFSFSSP